jgi:hypothetical protein
VLFVAYTIEELGRLIARAHYQAWRLDAPPFDLTPEELAAILPNLIKSGSAGIVWHRVKPLRERYGAMAYALEAATEAQIAHNRRVEEAVVECVTRLRAYGIEPVLVKGLALAKLYPEGIVRPAGDIDLVVRKEEFAAAHAILHDSSRQPIRAETDLQFPPAWPDYPGSHFWTSLLTGRVQLTEVIVPNSATHLEISVAHYLRHEGVRPMRVMDICMLIELYSGSYGNKPLPSESWTSPLAAVYEELFGLHFIPDEPTPYPIPAWLQRTVVSNLTAQQHDPQKASLAIKANPVVVPKLIAERWPGPLSATFWHGSSLSSRTPRSSQMVVFARRCRRFMLGRSVHHPAVRDA